MPNILGLSGEYTREYRVHGLPISPGNRTKEGGMIFILFQNLFQYLRYLLPNNSLFHPIKFFIKINS